MNAAPLNGLAFVCDSSGKIVKILRDALRPSGLLEEGADVRAAMESSSKAKWDLFLKTCANDHAAFSWQMDVATSPSAITTLEFAGAATDDGYVVVASPTGADAAVYEQLLSITNESSNALRDALKRLSMLSRPAGKKNLPPELLEEQTRINNELVNVQRELAQRNAELARRNAELALLIEQKNELLGVAAHDLRNPISAARGFCDVVLASSLDERQQRSLHRVRSSCDFMLRLVDDMLDFASIEAGNLELARVESNIIDVIQNNLEVNRDVAALKQIAIELAVDASRPIRAPLDAMRFDQVLNNLISNAVKYSHPSTTITVTVSEDREREWVSVVVRDQGQGISRDELGRLFKPFARTSTRATAGERSTGLGLAIVDRIVRAHGGSIAVESERNVGTAFTVCLPRSTATASSPA